MPVGRASADTSTRSCPAGTVNLWTLFPCTIDVAVPIACTSNQPDEQLLFQSWVGDAIIIQEEVICNECLALLEVGGGRPNGTVVEFITERLVLRLGGEV